MTVEHRVERHVLKPNSPYYALLRSFCMKAKCLYNHANYIIRQEFIKNRNWVRYARLDKMLKTDTEYPDYRNMPTAQSAQQTLRVLDSNWKSFFAAIKDYRKHPGKYLGRPKLPKYIRSNVFGLTLTSQECKIKDGLLKFPKVFEGFAIKPVFLSRQDFASFQQVRFIPEKCQIVIELVYTVGIPDETPYNGHCIGIDIGVNNLAAAASNDGERPFIINGRPLKAINQYYNKQKAHYQSILKRMEGRKTSKRLDRLARKRSRRMNDYMHKASKYLVGYCVKHGITRIVIGQNKGWKQDFGKGKKANQNFIQIPTARFITMASYKAKGYGIAVDLTEESYTSGTGFLDGEDPVCQNYDRKRRVYRGLFKANDGTYINADINAAYQIMKKVVPVRRDSGCMLHPFIVSL